MAVGYLFWINIVCLILSEALVAEAKCPCADESLCKPLEIDPREELLAFSVVKDSWKSYNYTHLTTIAVFGPNDPQVRALWTVLRHIEHRVVVYVLFTIYRSYAMPTRRVFGLFTRLRILTPPSWAAASIASSGYQSRCR